MKKIFLVVAFIIISCQQMKGCLEPHSTIKKRTNAPCVSNRNIRQFGWRIHRNHLLFHESHSTLTDNSAQTWQGEIFFLFLPSDLSFQAAQRVMSSEPQRALKVLRDISQNLPMQTRFVGDIFFHFCSFRFLFVDYLLVIFNPRSLVKTKVKEEMRKEIKLNQKVSSLKKLFSSLWQYTFIFTCSCLHLGFPERFCKADQIK